jgi:PAS domain S-box-containing protein
VSAVEARQRSPIWDRVLDALPVALVVIDEGGKVVAANERAGEILGCAPEDIAGGAMSEVVRGWARRHPAEAATPASPDEDRFESDHRRPDGTVVSIGLGESALPPDPETGLRLLCFQDVTPIHRVQQERDRLLQLAAVSEAPGGGPRRRIPAARREAGEPVRAASSAAPAPPAGARTSVAAGTHAAPSLPPPPPARAPPALWTSCSAGARRPAWPASASSSTRKGSSSPKPGGLPSTRSRPWAAGS